MKPIISNDSCYEMIAMIKSNDSENISDDDCEMIQCKSSSEIFKKNLWTEGGTFRLKANKSFFNSNSVTKWFEIFQILTLVVFVFAQR